MACLLLFIGAPGVDLVGSRPVAEDARGSSGGVGSCGCWLYFWPGGMLLVRTTLLPLLSSGDGRGTGPTGRCAFAWADATGKVRLGTACGAAGEE